MGRDHDTSGGRGGGRGRRNGTKSERGKQKNRKRRSRHSTTTTSFNNRSGDAGPKCQPLIKRSGLIIVAVVILLVIGNNLISQKTTQGSRLKEITNDEYFTFSSGSLPLCSMDQVHGGRWISKILQPNEIPYRTNHYNSQCGSGQGSDDAYYEGPAYSRTDGTIQSFEWIQNNHSSCFFEKWSTDSFCRALKSDTDTATNNDESNSNSNSNSSNNNNTSTGGASPSDIDVFIMGDSLTREQFLSLFHLLQGPNGSPDNQVDAYYPMTHDCGIQLVMRRLDYYVAKENMLSWELSHKNPTYVLINFGAHYVADPSHRWVIEHIAEDIRGWQNRCKLQNKECLMIWRTTVPGHPFCKSRAYEYPGLNFLNWTLPYAEKWLDAKHPPHHWADFGHQNEIVLEIFRASGIDFVVMDAYRINILRPDGHVGGNDCLHSCLGSKTDVYSQLLLHIIKLHKQGLLVI